MVQNTSKFLIVLVPRLNYQDDSLEPFVSFACQSFHLIMIIINYDLFSTISSREFSGQRSDMVQNTSKFLIVLVPRLKYQDDSLEPFVSFACQSFHLVMIIINYDLIMIYFLPYPLGNFLAKDLT